MKLEDWKKKNKNARCYAHFDEKISLTDDVWNYISNPQNIKKHGFYPFIHYQIIFKKYKKENGIGIVKEKKGIYVILPILIDTFILIMVIF